MKNYIKGKVYNQNTVTQKLHIILIWPQLKINDFILSFISLQLLDIKWISNLNHVQLLDHYILS